MDTIRYQTDAAYAEGVKATATLALAKLRVKLATAKADAAIAARDIPNAELWGLEAAGWAEPHPSIDVTALSERIYEAGGFR